VLQVTDFLAVAGLAVSIVVAVRWLLGARLGPVTLCAGYFAALALALSSLPGYMDEPFGFGRPVSPLLLWIMIEVVSREMDRLGATASGKPQCEPCVYQPVGCSHEGAAFVAHALMRAVSRLVSIHDRNPSCRSFLIQR